MPLNARKIAVNISVICFFVFSIAALLSGLSPFTCCKRAIIGSLFVYISAEIAIRLINMILIDAMITNQVEKVDSSEIKKQKDKARR